jgi:uncharacterized membrane protein
MKHILNNLSEEEKNAIREQHAGGMKVITENFSKLLNSKIGDVKPLVNEQTTDVSKNIKASTALGAGVGASVGSVVPVVGTVAGALVGGAVGALAASIETIIGGSGTSDQKVKSLCNLCRNTKSQITSNGKQLADKIRDAVQGAGTDETEIIDVIRSLRTFDEFCSMVKSYQSSYNADLYSDLDDDIDQESEWVQIFRPIRDLALKQKNTGIPSKTPTTTRPPAPQPAQRPNYPIGGVAR